MKWHNPNNSHAHPPWHSFNANFVGWCMHYADCIHQSSVRQVLDFLQAELDNDAIVLEQLPKDWGYYKEYAKRARLIKHLMGRITLLS